MQRFAALAGGFALSFLAQAIQAQTSDSSVMPPSTAASSSSAGPASHATASSTLDTVVVTGASKREERLQDVPESITYVGAAQLARQSVNAVSDLVRSAPALNTAGPFGELSIRGIGSISFSRSSEGSVGVVVDGVSLAGSSGYPPQLFDVARVEVLEGPQGTLFGRNASAGLINIVTNAPDPKRFEAIGHLDVGSRGDDMAQAIVNLPLSDSAALRISGAYGYQPEQLKNLYDGTWNHERLSSVRGRLLLKPTADLTVNLIADETQTGLNGGAPWAVYESTPGSVLSTALAQCGVQVGPENNSGCVNPSQAEVTNSFGFSGQADLKLGRYTVSSVTASRGINQNQTGADVDSSPTNLLQQPQQTTSHNVSEELRLSSPNFENGNYVVGLYYFNSRLNGWTTEFGPFLTYVGLPPYIPAPFPALLGQTIATGTATTSEAVFGQGTYKLSDQLRLNAGARFGEEKVSANTVGTLYPHAVAPIANLTPVNGAVTDHYASWKLGAQYDLSDDTMAYANFTRGYKGPAVNDQGGGTAAPLIVKPEIPHAIELGLKSTFLNGKLLANVAAFHTRVDNFQAQFFDPTVGQFIFSNAPSLTSQGVSMSLLGKPTTALNLSAGLIYTDATYGPGYLVACQQGSASGCVANADGHPLVGAPRWKATFSSEYTTPVFGQLGFVQADMVYQSRISFDAGGDPNLSNAASTIFGARAGLRSNDGRWGVSVFARNLFNTFRPSVRFATPVALQQRDPQSYVQIPGPDSTRVVGVSLDMRY